MVAKPLVSLSIFLHFWGNTAKFSKRKKDKNTNVTHTHSHIDRKEINFCSMGSVVLEKLGIKQTNRLTSYCFRGNICIDIFYTYIFRVISFYLTDHYEASICVYYFRIPRISAFLKTEIYELLGQGLDKMWNLELFCRQVFMVLMAVGSSFFPVGVRVA